MGDIQEMHDFRGFLRISRRVLDISSRNLFDSKILSSCCDKHQNFDYECSSYPVNEAQSPDFGRFLTILGIFRDVQSHDLSFFL